MLEFLKSVLGKASDHKESTDMTGALDLSELPTEALVKEIERRLECLNKPERRLVLIGEKLFLIISFK